MLPVLGAMWAGSFGLFNAASVVTWPLSQPSDPPPAPGAPSPPIMFGEPPAPLPPAADEPPAGAPPPCGPALVPPLPPCPTAAPPAPCGPVFPPPAGASSLLWQAPATANVATRSAKG